MNKNVKKERNFGVVTKDSLGLGERAHAITERDKNRLDYENDKEKQAAQKEINKQYDENGKLIPFIAKTVVNHLTYKRK